MHTNQTTHIPLLPATILDLASAQSPPQFRNNFFPFQAAATGGDPAAPALPSPHPLDSQHSTNDNPNNLLPAALLDLHSVRAPFQQQPFQAAATGGNPTAPEYSFPRFPLLDTASALDAVAQIWPAFGDLRLAAGSPRAGRLKDAISTLLAEARVIFFSELLTTCGTPASQHLTQHTPGAAVHS